MDEDKQIPAIESMKLHALLEKMIEEDREKIVFPYEAQDGVTVMVRVKLDYEAEY